MQEIKKIDNTPLISLSDTCLFIVYCFSPYVDPSAITAAKRVRTWGSNKIDVISNFLGMQKDPRLYEVTKGFMANHKEVRSSVSFDNWQGILRFINEAQCTANQWQLQNGQPYKGLYSRIMWPASHFAAFIYKKNNPDIHWSAEFSDPILFDMEGKMRFSQIDADWFNNLKINDLLLEHNYVLEEKDQNHNLYFWTALLPYLFADTIIFTNELQMSFMLTKFPFPFGGRNDEFIHHLKNKSIVKPHPILPKTFYSMGTPVKLNQDYINIAYFGTLNTRRNLNEVLESLEAIGNANIRLHIYTNNARDVLKAPSYKKTIQYIKIYPFIGYLDFLASIKEFQAVILLDSVVTPILGLNPYIPSKFSDYAGGEAPIWAIVEKGSTLDMIPDSPNGKPFYKSWVGNIDSHSTVLRTIILANQKVNPN